MSISRGICFFIAVGAIQWNVLEAQSSLTLSSGSALPGGTVTLDLSLASTAGSSPAALQWTFTFPSAVSDFRVTAGPVAMSAGKLITCAGGTTVYTCLAAGINSTGIANGVVAQLAVTLGGSAGATVGVTNVLAISAAAVPIGASGTGGTVALADASIILSSFACSPTILSPNSATTCTIDLTQSADPGGASVSLTSSILSAPATVTVPAGSSSATFTATAGSFTSSQTAVITASLNNSSRSAGLALWTTALPPASLSALQCAAGSLLSNSTTTCTVFLSAAAPSGGSLVSLSDTSSALSIPASVTIPAGSTQTTFTASTGVLTATQTATITASLNGSVRTDSLTLTLTTTVSVSSLQCVAGSLTPNTSTTCTVFLSAAAPSGGSLVSLSDTASALTIPASVTVPAGSTQVSFTASTGALTATQTATITASLNGSSQTDSLILTITISVSSLQCVAGSLTPNTSTTCTVSLSGAAPSGGSLVSLSDTSSALTIPASVTVPAGSTQISFTASASSFTATQTATVTASLNGSSQTDSLTLTITISISSLQCASGSLVSNTSTACTVSLSAAAPAGGSLVSLSDTASVLSIPASVTVPAGSTQISFTASASSFTATETATITASLNGASKTASVILAVLSLQSIRCSVTSLTSSTCSVTISGAAPAGGIAVALTSSSLLFSIPSSVIVPSGSTTAGFNGNIGLVSVLLPVVITAKLGSLSISITITLQPPLTLLDKTSALSQPAVLSCSPGFVDAGNSTMCELWMDSSARGDAVGPRAVPISSNSSHIKVPSTVTLRAGHDKVRFEVTADPDSTQETATVTALFEDQAVQESLAVSPAGSPVLTLPEKQSAKPGVPVHFTVIGVDGHDLPVTIAALQLPPGAQFDPSAGTFDWLPQEKDLGLYTITFAATNSLGVMTRKDLTLYVETGRPVITTLENAAARSASEGACSPGSVAMVTGRFLFGGEGFRSEPAGGRTELDGTRVLVNDVNAAVLYASAGRVDFVCPVLDPGTVLNVAIVTDAGPSIPLQIKMEETSPGILTLQEFGSRQALATNTQSYELAAIPNFQFLGNPAIASDSISIGVTGIQCAENSGQQVLLKIGASYAQINSVQPDGQAAGTCKLTASVPPFVAGDAVPVSLEVVGSDGRVRKSNEASIAVENQP